MTRRKEKRAAENVRYRSPNGRLPPEALERLRACIEEANRLLRALGNPRDDENLAQLRLHFASLRGALVRVEVDCKPAEAAAEHDPSGKCEVVGLLTTAGKDFIQLDAVGERLLVPYGRICSLQHHDANPREDEDDLRGIDPCLRMQLVLHFGETVACRPELLNRFLGIPLFLQLLQYVGCRVAIRTERSEPHVRGVLVDAKEHAVRIETGAERECKDVSLHEACVIVVHADSGNRHKSNEE
ncbi:hypothetical protein [Paenibacillus sp.]|uniref:hypothetical protein n=1 Tax=Paenibacillus sp. TaxID=58172 RepID=UPI002D3EDD9F|nr:hypothetical protein [Paenibacillus sp.]HZG55958.1 hypothetical protein [Paenibacillus sp.]